MFFDCNSDISAHLTSCHLSKCGDVTEGPLVLARAGISRLSATQVAGMTICSRPEVLSIPWGPFLESPENVSGLRSHFQFSEF